MRSMDPVTGTSEPIEPHGWQENAALDAPRGYDSEEFPLSVIGARDQVVLLTEEYGYRHWIWWTGMSNKDLAAFWIRMESVIPHFFDPPETLPGKLREVIRHGESVYSDASRNRPTNVFRFKDPFWKGHLHMEDDSYLTTPEGKRILHKGAQDTPL